MLSRYAIIGLMSLFAGQAVADQGHVTILFHVRPPYAEQDSGKKVTGTLADPAVRALEKAGMTADWIEMPPARQTEEIKRAKSAVCGLGWFKRPEREAFAVFTDAIYRDQPTVAVARRKDARFSDGMSLRDSFRDRARTLIVKTSYSYGATIDSWIRELRPNAEDSTGDDALLLGMIAQSRVDYGIMAPEEAENLLRFNAELRAALRIVRLGDAPVGEARHLMCSKTTPAELIARLNEALAP